MSYGIQVVNSVGITVIDDNYSNYAVYSSGSIGPIADGTGYYYYDIGLPNIPGILVFMRSQTNAGVFWVTSGGGAGTTLRIGGMSAVNIDYLLLIPSSSLAAPSGYGLNIYRGDGSLAFSSEYSYANVVALGQFYNPSYMIPGGVSIPAPVAQNRTKYFCISACHLCGYYHYSGQDPASGNILAGDGVYRLEVAQNSNLSFDFYQAQDQYWDPYGPPLYGTGSWSFAILTGYFFMTIIEY